jgi:Flp pilus assembly protein CpaB
LCGIGICLLLALNSAMTRRSSSAASARPATSSTPVVVAAGTLPVGHVLARSDLRAVAWPSSLRPASAQSDPDGLVGRRLSGPLARGEPVTTTRLLGRDLAAGLPAGLVAAAVPVADGHAVDLVHPGDHVDVIATPRAEELAGKGVRGSVTTLARDAPALAILADGSATSDASAAEVVVAVPRAEAVAISRAAPTSLFTVVLLSP